MANERYAILVREITQYIKYNNIEDPASLLNDLKFDVLETLYETDTSLRVVKRGIKIEPFSKEKLSENLAISSDNVSDEMIAEVLDTDQILEIVDGVVNSIESTGKKVVSSDEIVDYTKKYLSENGYNAALEGYSKVNDRKKYKWRYL